MGQLSKAERDLLQKLMKAREGRDSTVKAGKVINRKTSLCPKAFQSAAMAGISQLLAHMHVRSLLLVSYPQQ